MSNTPELFFSHDEWLNLKAKLADPFFAKIHEHNLEALRLLEAEKNGDDVTDVPIRLGLGQPKRTKIHERVLKNRMIRGTIAFYLTQKPEYLTIAWDAIERTCASPEWRPKPSNGLRGMQLSACELFYTVAFGYDALKPHLTAAQRERCVSTLRDVGLPQYLKALELHDWWENCDFNWGAAIHGNAGLAALAIRDEAPELSARVLKEVKTRLRTVINSFYPGGGYTEGVMYQGGCIGWMSDFIIALHRLEGDTLGLLENKDFHDTITTWQYLKGGDERPYNFSNVDAGTNEWGITQVFWWADKLKRPDWSHFQEQTLRDWRDTHACNYDVEAFFFRQPFQPVTPPVTAGVKHFQGIDWLTWKGAKSWLGFRSGFNGGNHNNKDLGSFILGYGTERFLIDPGYGAWMTEQHNAVTVRGQQQTDAATAKITTMKPLPNGFYLKCELTEGFPHALQHFRRHLLLLDDQHLLVLDDILGRGPRPQSAELRTSAKWYLQTRLPWSGNESSLTVQGRDARMKVMLLSDVGFLESKDWDWDGPLTTLTWRHIYDRHHDIHPMLLTFGDPKVDVRRNGSDLAITIDGHALKFSAASGELTGY